MCCCCFERHISVISLAADCGNQCLPAWLPSVWLASALILTDLRNIFLSELANFALRCGFLRAAGQKKDGKPSWEGLTAGRDSTSLWCGCLCGACSHAHAHTRAHASHFWQDWKRKRKVQYAFFVKKNTIWPAVCLCACHWLLLLLYLTIFSASFINISSGLTVYSVLLRSSYLKMLFFPTETIKNQRLE